MVIPTCLLNDIEADKRIVKAALQPMNPSTVFGKDSRRAGNSNTDLQTSDKMHEEIQYLIPHEFFEEGLRFSRKDDGLVSDIFKTFSF